MFGDPKVFILVHVALSVAAIFAGFIVVGGFMAGVRFPRWIGVFLLLTTLTSVTGFGFPFGGITPAHIFGALSLLALAGAGVALYFKQLAGGWRSVFVIASVLALYLNAFVLVAQLFQKIPALAMLAPSQDAPAFAATQLLVLLSFAGLGRAALKGFAAHPSR